MKKITIYLILILAVNAGFLLTPKLRKDDPKSIHMFEINSYLHSFVAMDALGYITSSMHPSILLNQYAIRQSRPVYIIQNAVIGRCLFFLTSPFHDRMLHSAFFNRLGQRIVDINEVVITKLQEQGKYPIKLQSPNFDNFTLAVEIPVFYMAYIVSNLIALLLCLIFFESIWKKISNVQVDSLLFYIACFSILANMLEKSFFWTAHQQMLALLAPVFCIWTSLSIMDGNISGLKKIFPFFFAGGILMLYYGNFILLFPALALPYLWIHKKDTSIGQLVLFTMTAAVLFILPTLIWILVLKSIGVVYYNHEIEGYRQLVWIFDMRHLAPVGIVKNIYSQCIYFFRTLKVLIPVLFWLCLVFSLMGSPLHNIRKDEKILMTLAFILVSFSFYFLLGFYGDRLTFSVAVALFCLTPFVIDKNKVTLTKTSLLGSLSFIWYLYIVFSYGSYN